MLSAYVLVQLADSAWEALRHIRQAADFLVCSISFFLKRKKIPLVLIHKLNCRQLKFSDMFSCSFRSLDRFSQTDKDVERDTQ